MLKSKRLTYFALGAILATSISIYLSTQATKKIHKGYSFLLEGEITQASESYQQAQKLWPILFYESETNSIIKFTKECIENAKSITVFMKKDAEEVEIQSLMEEIKTINGIREVKYISKEDRLNEYKEKNKDNPLLLELVNSDILPASILIQLEDPSLTEIVTSLAKSKAFVDQVN